MGKDNSKVEQSQKTIDEQANTIAKLKNEVKKLGDPNAGPRIIQKGNQVHPKYQRNKIKVAATIQIENPKPK